jgi:hypothetical protein
VKPSSLKHKEIEVVTPRRIYDDEVVIEDQRPVSPKLPVPKVHAKFNFVVNPSQVRQFASEEVQLKPQ